MAADKQSKNLKALSVTIAVHAVIILGLFSIGFSTPPPLPDQDLGMEVNLGDSEDGMGDVQPMNPNPPAASQPVTAPAPTTPAPVQETGNERELATQEEEEAPEVKQPVKVAPKPKEIAKTIETKTEKAPKPKKVEEAKPAPVVPPKPKAVMGGGTTNTSQGGNSASGNQASSGEGNTGKPGDRGVAGGDPNATNYSGTPGTGRGASDFNLRGRNLVNRPSASWDGNESGYVAIQIKVDRSGKVINATYTLNNSTITNPRAIQIARDAALKIRYNASTDAPEEQFGTIRFYFKPQ
jgi:outer membrane biosynthesis protein TonB